MSYSSIRAAVSAHLILTAITVAAVGCAKPIPESEVPYEVVGRYAIYTPDPSLQALHRTRTGQAGVAATTVVSFCVASDGTAKNVVVAKSSRDREFDAICRDTVATWQFEPFGGDVEPCSRITFKVTF